MLEPTPIGGSSEGQSGSSPNIPSGNNSFPSGNGPNADGVPTSPPKSEPEEGGRTADPPEVDAPDNRLYRAAPVRTVTLPDSFVEEAGGAFTRKGTPRLEVLSAARAAYVQRKSESADSDVLKFDSGAIAVREEGTHVKSIQGHAEDLWRRIYKRPIPEGDPLDDSEFRSFYDRTRRALKRSGLMSEKGPAVQHESKPVRDRHGKKWVLSDGLKKAERGRETADPPPLVRCTGPKADGDTADVWACVERRVAREENLHRELTHAVTTRRIADPEDRGEDRREFKYFTADGRRFERRYQRDGSDVPRYISVGRWHPDAPDRDDRHQQPVRVPWLIAEIDGDGRKHSDELARRLLDRLGEQGMDLSSVLVSYSGNRSIHVRIPDGAVGCPIYRNSRVARQKIRDFFRELCGDDQELYRALDGALFSPNQLIRAIGTPHEKTGRHCVATTADRFLEKPAEFLWSLSEQQFQYSPPLDYPIPRNADFTPPLALSLTVESDSVSEGAESERSTEKVPFVRSVREREGAVHGRLLDGVPEGVEEGIRNTSALYVAHEMFRRCPTATIVWKMMRRWNQKNDPPLPKRELRGVFEKVRRWRRGRIP